MRVLTWNLFHGRSVPDVPRPLAGEFAAAIAGWDWDVALLQEVPPWWPPHLAAAAGAQHRTVLTSRNAGLGLRRAIASRRPDLLKSNGGGANAILVRSEGVVAHARRRLRLRPERRVVHAVRLASGGWVANVHAQVRPHSETRRDLAEAGVALRRWSSGGPWVLLGGDLNVPDPEVAGFTRIPGPRGVDHVLVGPGLTGRARRLERAGLSDHAPVLAELVAG